MCVDNGEAGVRDAAVFFIGLMMVGAAGALGALRGHRSAGIPEIAWSVLLLGGVAIVVIRYFETRRRR